MGKILFEIYKLLSPIGILFIYVISIFLKTKSFSIKSFKKRFLTSKISFNDKTVIFHCSSLGELNSIKEMIEILKKKFPRNQIIITTFTETALEFSKKITPNSFLIPFDFKKSVKKFLDHANPGIVFISETEIWPIFITEAAKKCKIYYINSRMSQKSFKFYSFFSPLFKYVFNNVEKFFVQDGDSFKNFSNFVPENKLITCGNTKYDNLKEVVFENTFENEIKKIDFENKKIIVFGSIHPDEIEVIIKSYNLIKKQISDIRYIIVPRHPEKTKEFENIINNYSLKSITLTSVSSSNDTFKDFYDTDILFVDKLGVLMYFYNKSVISFVGGTLNKIGGHNILEPAIFSKPVLFGPNYQNQKEAAQKLIENCGGFVVSDEYDLKSRLIVLLSDEKNIQYSGFKAKQTLLSLQGATNKIIKEIWK